MTEQFKHRLIKARKTRGLTQVQASTIARITQGAYSRLETGDAVNSKHLASLASALNVSLDWLANGHGQMFGTTDNPLVKKLQDDIATISDESALEALENIVEQLKRI